MGSTRRKKACCSRADGVSKGVREGSGITSIATSLYKKPCPTLFAFSFVNKYTCTKLGGGGITSR